MKDKEWSSNEEAPDRVIHSVDGIEEYDNRLPLWWLYTLYGAVAFGAVYFFHYEVIKSGPSLKAEFDQDMAVIRAAEADRARAAGAMTPEALVALSKDPKTIAAGREIFTSTCAACHRTDGGGNIGPNLTDEFWIHGSKPTDIFRNVMEGVPAKGMPAWGAQIGMEKVANVAAYVLTIQNSNVAGGKPPQGEKM